MNNDRQTENSQTKSYKMAMGEIQVTHCTRSPLHKGGVLCTFLLEWQNIGHV